MIDATIPVMVALGELTRMDDSGFDTLRDTVSFLEVGPLKDEPFILVEEEKSGHRNPPDGKTEGTRTPKRLLFERRRCTNSLLPHGLKRYLDNPCSRINRLINKGKQFIDYGVIKPLLRSVSKNQRPNISYSSKNSEAV